MEWPLTAYNGSWDDPAGPPPGSPPTYKFEGPWFTTQLTLSATIGLISFLIFSYSRKRWPLLFAPRTKLKGFSPHEAHAHEAFFGWILPTIRTSEFTVLQIVGLDAAVLLNFFKMSFYLFSVCSIFATFTLMPINLRSNLGIGDEDEDNDWPTAPYAFAPNSTQPTKPGQSKDWLDLISDANSYLTIHLLFTYLFTGLALYFIQKNYRRFIRARQLFSLELVHSIPARTVMITDIPKHLQSERAVAEYFENMNLSVESATICREVGNLKALLDKRTNALLNLEAAWVKYVGNPSTVEAYDPSNSAPAYTDGEPSSLEAQQSRLVVPHRKRPSMRPGWFKSKVDALEYLEARFKEADDAVKSKRKAGKFKPAQTAFVTFEKMSSAQIAVQTAHSPTPTYCITHLAPEPRDIVWANMTHSQNAMRIREVIVLSAICVLLLFWVVPITFLASLLSYKEIKKVMPWLARLIDRNDKVQAIVQNSLPSVAMISLNALLPFLLEGLTYLQGYRARSWVEYSLLKKYFIFLLTNVVFIFLLASTYWQLVRDLANSPAKIPEKLAQALLQGRARHFFLSYVILQGLGIMPLQLLNLGVIIPRAVMLLFVTRTPRDFAELNAPPMINYGVVYPQAILIFVITILYSVVQPLIVIFGAIYFGVAYVVYKYKLLFVFYKPYESQGQAWPITFTRLIWGVIIFQIFMIGNFVLRSSFILSALVGPLLLGTLAWAWYTDKMFKPLSKYVSLSSVYEVERGEETADVVRLRAGHPVTWSQSNLNRRRYAQNDETLYVAPEDARTDYSQPPMANWYSGVLNTGKRRYGHPALTGVLPQPWLPLKKGQALVNNGRPQPDKKDEAVVLTLRKRVSTSHRASRLGTGARRDTRLPDGQSTAQVDPWREGPHPPLSHRLSYDHGSGVIMLPEDGAWLDDAADESDSDEDLGSVVSDSQREVEQASTISEESPSKQRHGTYYHHPERRRQTIPGAFPRM
ncbi:DUF221-domain-containing protein [Heliocybe sulcata]|uniref:DUF221-domain-containing protein n=1 Tax=Heliocybe sulcata TaxID=5364 RepID=A0A5C3MPY1_9AGAM|nr:DUF221-domain-containing protein [Heliocybe sulcata]